MITQTILNRMIENHKLWLEDETQGEQFVLKNENIEELDFRQADLRKCIINNTRIKKSCLKNVNFNQSSFEYCEFTECEMNKVLLEESNLKNLLITICGAPGISFKNSNIQSTRFVSCSLESSNFSSDQKEEEGQITASTKLYGVIFFRCILARSNFEKTILSEELKKTILNTCNLSECNLRECSFVGNDFKISIIKGSNIQETDFSKSDLSNTDFKNNLGIDDSNFQFSKGNGEEIVDFKADDFTCVSVENYFYIDDLKISKEDIMSKTEEELVITLKDHFEPKDPTYNEEYLMKWLSVWKPIFLRI